MLSRMSVPIDVDIFKLSEEDRKMETTRELKSLDTLKDSMFVAGGSTEENLSFTVVAESNDLARKIQDEVDKYYLPRPLFEDGEPIQFCDLVNDTDGECRLPISAVAFVYTKNGVAIFDRGEEYGYFASYGQRFNRPSEPDTQEKINEDKLLDPVQYCRKYSIAFYSESNNVGDHPSAKMVDHILKRQRKVDEME